MGLLTIIKKQKIKEKEVRILTLGLDNSGKTTIIKGLLHEDTESVSPTMGFQIHSLGYKDYTLNIWDIGGQQSLRNFWSNYFDKTNIVVWVIDCLALERFDESYTELKEKVIEQDRLVSTYLMILVNKIDLLDPSQHSSIKDRISNILDLDLHIPQKNQWSLHMVSGKTGFGLNEVLDWFVSKEF